MRFDSNFYVLRLKPNSRCSCDVFDVCVCRRRMLFVDVCMNGRNVDQIIRQRRQHRVGRLAVATMFYEKEARRRDQERRDRGQLVATQRTSEYKSTPVLRKPVRVNAAIVPFPYCTPTCFNWFFISVDENRERRASSVLECGCRSSGHHQNTTVRPSGVLDRYNIICGVT